MGRSSSSAMKRSFDSYFTEVSVQKRIFYIFLVLYVGLVILVSVAEPMLTPASCLAPAEETDKEFGNSLFQYNPCRYTRKAYLLFFTPDECSYCRRLVFAVLLGGLIGWERRQVDRPAGIRTMALVSLGSCLFTIDSAFAFVDGPMEWDASRISAAIPSGVGFLGAGLIFQQKEKDETSGSVTHVVLGLTTAASLWLSAAVGVASGGELYFAASYGTAVLLTLLRFGPRLTENDDDDDYQVENEGFHKSLEAAMGSGGGMDEEATKSERRESETSSLITASRGNSTSTRNRAHLASVV